MARLWILISLALAFSLTACGKGGEQAGTSQTDLAKGGELFHIYCEPCHKDGGNIINPDKTLSRSDREANGINTASDIVRVMRNPGPRMPKFDDVAIPDDKARAIAEYILHTF